VFDAVEDAVMSPIYDALVEACAAAVPVSDAITELPSLAVLSTILDAAIEVVLQPFLDDLATRLAPVLEVVGDLPDVADLVQQLRDLLDLGILTDTDPLARLEVRATQARASFDRASGDVTTEGSAGLVQIPLAALAVLGAAVLGRHRRR